MCSALHQQPDSQRFCKDPEGFHDDPEPLPPGSAWFADYADQALYPSPVCGSCAVFLMLVCEHENYMWSGGEGYDEMDVVAYQCERVPKPQ